MSIVDEWMAGYQGSLKPEMQRVREVILDADPRIRETIKWQAPTFEYGAPMASFNPRSKAHVSLLFHKGSSIPGTFASLEGDAAQARTMRFADLAEVEAKSDELRNIVRAWCDMKDADGK